MRGRLSSSSILLPIRHQRTETATPRPEPAGSRRSRLPDRPSSVRDPAHEASRTTAPQALRAESVRGLVKRHTLPLALAANLIVIVAAFLVFSALRPQPRPLTQDDIDAAVSRSLQTLPPKPPDAAVAFAAIQPSVVSVLASAQGKDGDLGTGVVMQRSGVIITAGHVVRDASSVTVVYSDGSQSQADVILRQPENDLAVLRAQIVPDDLKPATFSSAGGLQIGDEVLAVGDPFGVVDSATFGVVSGMGREFHAEGSAITLKNLIQFDAAVNPGNSGGPLVDRDGHVIGIVTGLLNPTGQGVFVGIGFAVPIETAAGAIGASPY